MRIERLSLRNFRGFEDFEMTLHHRCTVIAGVNGAGKSSVLDGLAVALGAWFLGFDSLPPRNIRPQEIRQVLNDDPQQPTLEPQFPVRVEAVARLPDAPAQWARELRGASGHTTSGEAADLRDRARIVQQAVRDPAKTGQTELPLLAYYGAGRLWVQKRASGRKEEGLGSRLDGYVDCLDAESNHKLFEAWMRDQEAVRIQRIAEDLGRGRVVDPSVSRPPLLTAVQNTAVGCIDGALRLFYDVAYKDLRVHFRDGRMQSFSLLADGYRNLVALAADLAWRAVRLNPQFGGEALQRTVGVVLIDEIELHLHPGWQRTVLPRLTALFPQLQFVVTTHSPQVLASVAAEQVRFLDAEGNVHHVGAAGGLDSNTILTHLMGVPERPEAMIAELAALGSLIEKGDAEAARTKLMALRAQLGDIDRDLATLEWELHDLEVNGAPD